MRSDPTVLTRRRTASCKAMPPMRRGLIATSMTTSSRCWIDFLAPHFPLGRFCGEVQLLRIRIGAVDLLDNGERPLPDFVIHPAKILSQNSHAEKRETSHESDGGKEAVLHGVGVR